GRATIPAPAGAKPPWERAGNRRSATLVRCWRCKIMVESDASGACPRCGTPAPKVASAPLAVVAPTGQRWLVAFGALAAAALAFAFVAPRLLERLRHPSETVAGEYLSPHLGVKLVFPAGAEEWRH